MRYYFAVANDISSISPDQLGNAKLLTVDAENVLTDYGNPILREEALPILESWESMEPGRCLAIATNNTDRDFIEELSGQLPEEILVFSGLGYASKKKSSEMFLAACEALSEHPSRAVHIDDQRLSHRGAKLAGFAGGVLVKPYGRDGHRGVAAFRIFDQVCREVYESTNAARSIYRDGLFGS